MTRTRARGSARTSERGLTIVEIILVMVIMVLAVSLVGPAVNNVTRAELKAAAGKLAGAIRYTYARAAFEHTCYRMVFHFSGNPEEPDTPWAEWVAANAEGRAAGLPRGRYLQWRTEISGPGTRLSAVSVASREQNLPPRVDDVTVAAQAQGLRDGEIGPRSEAVTQTLEGGQKVEYSVNLSSNKALRELPSWARGLRTLQWRASDPNGDPLRFQVQVRDEASRGEWITVGKDLVATLHSWDTRTLPDGRYRVRVLADDAKGNALGESLRAEGMSEAFEVDSTPRAVTRLEAAGVAGGLRVTVEAEDARSPLWQLAVSVDDGEWRSLAPPGGTLDDTTVRLTFTLPDLSPGEHLVSVRAVDMAGNPATRAVRATVPR